MQDDSRDADTEVGDRATQDAKAEGGGRERLEHVLEVEKASAGKYVPYIFNHIYPYKCPAFAPCQHPVGNVRTTAWTQEVENVWNTFSNMFSRVHRGKEPNALRNDLK